MNRVPVKSYHRHLILFLGFGLTSQVVSVENPEQAAKQMLVAMIEAVETRTYQGTFVYQRDKKVETMRVFHTFRGGVERERIVALNSPMREVIRQGNEVTCYYPNSQLVFVNRQPSVRSFLLQLPENLDKYSKFYSFILTGHEYVIHKETQVIHILPKDDYRYGRKIWIDIEDQLPLKFELIDEEGELVEQMMFTELDVVDDISSELLTLSANVEKNSNWKVRDRQEVAIENQGWVFKDVPNGFHQVFYSLRKMSTGNHPLEHILFSDGFSSVSVYVDKKLQDNLESYQNRMGAINSYSRLLNGYQITVLGAVPGKTVQAIGDGVNFSRKVD